MNKKKWLTLSLIGTALALIPRRSSRQTPPSANGHLNDQNHASEYNANDTQSKEMVQYKNSAQ